MNIDLQNIADCLRAEIFEYGRLLQLFEEQQSCLFKRNGPGVLRVTNEIDEQVGLLTHCRRARENAASDFARALGAPPTTMLGSLLPLVPSDTRPLLQALVKEVNRLALRLRRISRHNRLFLIRTIENHQELLRRLRPGSFTKVYSPAGRVRVAPSSRSQALSAEV